MTVRERTGLALADDAPRPAGRLRLVVRWALYLFAFSVPIESVLKSSLGTEATLARFTGYALLSCVLLFSPSVLRRPNPAAIYFGTYLIIAAIHGVFAASAEPRLAAFVIAFVLQRAQLFLLFFLLCHLFAVEREARRALIAFAGGAVLLAIAVLAGIGDMSEFARASAYGEDPNHNGNVLALAAVALLGMRTLARSAAARFALWGAVSLTVAGALATGSRGAVVVFLVGAVTLLGPRMRKRPISTALVVAAVAGLVAYQFDQSAAGNRWRSTLENRDTAERSVIYSAAIDMFLERPLLGWGPATHYVELGKRVPALAAATSEAVGTHNVLLGTLTSVGLLGAFPYLLAVAVCVVGAFRSRQTVDGALAWALCIGAILFAMTIDADRNKAYWMLLALGGASFQRVGRRMNGAPVILGAARRGFAESPTPGRRGSK